MTFEDRFAYAVSVAQLRDGLQGSVEELRASSSTEGLEDILSNRAREDLLNRFTRVCSVEEYNMWWAEAYLAQVERNERSEVREYRRAR